MARREPPGSSSPFGDLARLGIAAFSALCCAALPVKGSTMMAMAVSIKKLDLRIGDVVEIDGRRYDVVSDRAGGVALEPAITVSSRELHERHGTRPAARDPGGVRPAVRGPARS